MLKYIIEEPSPESNKKRMYKFPFVVAEAFKTESNTLISLFFENSLSEPSKNSEEAKENKELSITSSIESTTTSEAINQSNTEISLDEPKSTRKEEYPVLDRLLSFVRGDPELNPVLAGYFSKTLQAIMNSHKSKLFAYLFGNDQHIENLLKHCYNQSIIEVTSRILAFDKELEKDEYSKQKEKFVNGMFESIDNAVGEVVNKIRSLKNLVQLNKSTTLFTSKSSIGRMYKLAIEGNGLILREALGYLVTVMKLKLEPGIQTNNTLSLVSRLQQRLGIVCTFSLQENSKECIKYVRTRRNRL